MQPKTGGRRINDEKSVCGFTGAAHYGCTGEEIPQLEPDSTLVIIIVVAVVVLGAVFAVLVIKKKKAV